MCGSLLTFAAQVLGRLPGFDTRHATHGAALGTLATRVGEMLHAMLAGKPPMALLAELGPSASMFKVAVLSAPYLATTGSTDCIWRLGAALHTQKKRPSVSNPTKSGGLGAMGRPGRHCRCVWPYYRSTPLYLEPRQLREAVAQEVEAAEAIDVHTHLFAANAGAVASASADASGAASGAANGNGHHAEANGKGGGATTTPSLMEFGIDHLLTYHYVVAQYLAVAAEPPHEFGALPLATQAERVWHSRVVRVAVLVVA